MSLELESPTPALSSAPRDLAAWVREFRSREIPVFAETADMLEALRINEDALDARALAEVVSGDPLMTLKLLSHAGMKRPSHATGEAETVTAALVMMGIGPFFRAFGPQPSIEARLSAAPAALEGLRAVARRAHRAARFALSFAVHRRDHDAAVIHEAALLHDFAEMLLWCHAPTLALVILQRQQADATLRSAAVQREVLHIELADLQRALMCAWRLPELLVWISDERHAGHPSVRSVALAVRLARHTAHGWDNAAVPDDVRDVSSLLQLAIEPTLKMLRDVDG
jgi:HD-like signal output (HDOD) protein